MPDLLSENEFTERFREAIEDYNLAPSCKEPLILELHYGDDEPVLNLSLKEAYARYQANAEPLAQIFEPYLKDLNWTIQEPRYASKELYEHCLPVLRNFDSTPPDEFELEKSPKGPIVFEDVLKAPNEYVVMQFNIFKDSTYLPLHKGDTLPCIPDANLLAQLSLHNLALATEERGITATPLQFESLRARSYLVGLADERYKPSVAALSCITAVMASLEETLQSQNGLIAVMPAQDQLIVSIDNNEESIVELGVLAQQILKRSAVPLSSLVWTFEQGQLKAVQALSLQELPSDAEQLSDDPEPET